MEELLKARVQAAVNQIVRKDSNIARELLEDYKERLVNSVCDIFAALSDLYENEDAMKERIEEFVEDNIKGIANSRGYNTDGYLVASVPVLLPIEAVAMVDRMDDIALPLILSQLSGWMMKTVVELREYEKLSDKILEEQGAKLADTLKDKGWIA